LDSAIAAVKADVIRFVAIDHGGVVDIGDVGDVHVVDGAVVVEAIPFPTAAFVALTVIAIAVINSTVKTDNGSPIALMKKKAFVVPGPVAGGP